jgi:hypothetical protein
MSSEPQPRATRLSARWRLVRWLIPLSVVVTFLGYVGPWVDHTVAGLVIAGLDLGEYVKFLLPVRSGAIQLWREGFYLPLVTISLASSLYAFQRPLRYGWPLRILLILFAVVAALNLLPPAWSPSRLLTPEFRLQTAAILLCVAAASFSPFLGLIPLRLAGLMVAPLALVSLWLPVQGFLRVLPTISELYNQPLTPGWGIYVMGLGLVALGAGALLGAWGGVATSKSRRQ